MPGCWCVGVLVIVCWGLVVEVQGGSVDGRECYLQADPASSEARMLRDLLSKALKLMQALLDLRTDARITSAISAFESLHISPCAAAAGLHPAASRCSLRLYDCMHACMACDCRPACMCVCVRVSVCARFFGFC